MTETFTIDATDEVVDQPKQTKPPRASRAVATKMERMPLPASAEPMNLIMLAVDRGADIGVITQLVALQERVDANNARKAFNLAIAAAKAELPVIMKNRRVKYDAKRSDGKVDYAHEDLAQIAEQIDEVLAKHGLSYRFRTSQPDVSRVAVTCIISHELGHSEENTLAAGIDVGAGKNHIQAVGSATTYLSRYTLKAALGLAASEDDDGQASGSPTGGEQKSAPRASAAPRASQQADTSKPHKMGAAFKGESWAQWGERYITAIKTADSVAVIEAWDRANDQLLEAMFNKNSAVYDEVNGAYERHKATLAAKEAAPRSGPDPITTGRQQATPKVEHPDPLTDYEGFLKWVEDKLVNWSAETGDLEAFWTAYVQPHEAKTLFPSDKDDLMSLYRKAEHRIGG